MAPIAAADVKLYLSAPAATQGNATAGTVGNSLGKYMSSTQVSSTALNNLFADLTGQQNADSQVDYQCVFILNDHATNSMLNTVVWINNQVAGGTTVKIALDPTTTTPKGTASPTVQAKVTANATTIPTGLVSGDFVAAATAGAGLNVGTIPAGNVKAIWVQRTAANTAAVNNDGFTLQVDFDTQG